MISAGHVERTPRMKRYLLCCTLEINLVLWYSVLEISCLSCVLRKRWSVQEWLWLLEKTGCRWMNKLFREKRTWNRIQRRWVSVPNVCSLWVLTYIYLHSLCLYPSDYFLHYSGTQGNCCRDLHDTSTMFILVFLNLRVFWRPANHSPLHYTPQQTLIYLSFINSLHLFT